MLKIKIDIDMAKLQAKRSMAEKEAQKQLDQDVLKDSNYYIPKDESTLEGSGIRASKIGEGEVAWDTVYARRLYYNPQYNFSKDRNPNAQGLWFEVAKSNYKGNWLKNVKEQYKKYFDGR